MLPARSLRVPAFLALLVLSWAEITAAEMPQEIAEARAAMGVNNLPMIKSWVPGAFPRQLPPSLITGKAVVRIIVDAQGAMTSSRVVEASDAAFGDAALAAIRQWTWSPGADEGKPVAMCIDVPFEFDRNNKAKPGMLPPMHLEPYAAPRVDSVLLDDPLGEYPAALVGRGLPGEVLFSCRLLADGTYRDLKIIHASHTDFVLPAMESAPRWKFKPAMMGDLPIDTDMKAQVTYSDTKTPPRAEVLGVNGYSSPDGTQPEYAPLPAVITDPVWPHERLMAGEGGTAVVEFLVGPNGVVKNIKIREASHPDFGGALVAAMEATAFNPAMARGVGVEVPLIRRAEWKAVSADASVDAEDWLPRLVARARAKAIRGGKGLDERLSPIYRVSPERPHNASVEEKGEAVVEFVVDRDGRARLPRVVSATRSEFGWAAATAASQWIFKAPKRGGQPTEVVVQVPFSF